MLVVVYTFTIHEAVLKKVDVFVGGKMCKEMRRWMRRRENNKNGKGGKSRLRRR